MRKTSNCALSTRKGTKKNVKQGFKSKHISPESSENLKTLGVANVQNCSKYTKKFSQNNGEISGTFGSANNQKDNENIGLLNAENGQDTQPSCNLNNQNNSKISELFSDANKQNYELFVGTNKQNICNFTKISKGVNSQKIKSFSEINSQNNNKNSKPSNSISDQNTLDICPSCGANLRRNAVICGVNFSFRVMCSCEKEKLKKAEEEQKIREKLHKVRELKALSLFGERYKNASFQSSKTGINPSFDKAFERCKKYCELFERTVKEGYGIYLFGPKGAGKTHLTACMANFLLSKCVPVLFTNLFEISKAVKSTFNRASSQTEQILIEKFSSIDVLFFDDIGSEIFSKNSGDTWLQGLLFDLLNKRYNNQKATIFTSNYSLNQLINERKIMEKTVDRINEMTSGAVIKISGESFRREKSREVIF